MIEQVRDRMTAERYFQSDTYDQHDLIQLIDGEIVIDMPPIPLHQFVVGEIFVLLRSFARALGGRAYMSPIEVFLADKHVYEPDVLFLAPESQCDVQEKRLVGAPELVVEVLSPSTAKYDRGIKFETYQAYGVAEYWIVDPAHETLEIWVLVDAAFQRVGVFDSSDTLTAPTLGAEIAVHQIFGVEPPATEADSSPDEATE